MRKTLAIILTSLLLFLVISCDLLIKKQVPAEDTGTDSFYFINNNIPQFSETEKNRAAGGCFIELSELDYLGRVGAAIACFDYEHMPTEDRKPLSTNPTGGLIRCMPAQLFPVDGFTIDHTFWDSSSQD